MPRTGELIVHVRLGDMAHAVNVSAIISYIGRLNSTMSGIVPVSNVVAGSKGLDRRYTKVTNEILGQLKSDVPFAATTNSRRRATASAMTLA